MITCSALKENLTYYYKYGSIPNANIWGTPSQSNGVMGSFSTSNYLLTTPFNPTNSWEIGLKVTTGSDISNLQYIVGAGGVSYGRIAIGITSSKFVYGVSSNNSSWNVVTHVNGSHTISANTMYYIRAVFNGSSYTYSISTNGTTYETDLTVSSSTKVISMDYPLSLGANKFSGGANVPFAGTIDLKKCYFTYGDEKIWTGTYPEKATSSDYDFSEQHTIYKGYAEVDKYWKNIDTAWTNPYLASNGTMGGANPACTGKNIKHYDYYYPFRSNAPVFNEGWCGQGLPNWLIYYNPTPVLVTTMSFVNREFSEYIDAVTSGIIQGSNDGTTYENIYPFTNNVTGSNQSWSITVNATKAYKYIRIYITGVTDAGTDNACWFSKVTINGYERTVVEGTADDYDFITYKKPRYGVR